VRRLLTERQKDGVATVVIRTGGLLVILVVLAIVVNIGVEALPLFAQAKEGSVVRSAASPSPLLAGSDPRRELVWVLGADGRISFDETALHDLEIVGSSAGALVAADQEIHGFISAIDADGTAVVGRLRFSDSWAGDQRTTGAQWRQAAEPVSFGVGDWVGVTANVDDDRNVMLVAWDREGRLGLRWWDADEEAWTILEPPASVADSTATVAAAYGLDSLVVVDTSGELRVFHLPVLDEVEVVGADAPTAAARFLIGGGSLVTAGRDGSVGVLLEIPRVEVQNSGPKTLRVGGVSIGPGEATLLPDDEIGQRLASRGDVTLESAPSRWQRVRELDGVPGTPTVITPEHRRRGFAIGTADGTVALYYSTSGRRLLLDRWAAHPVTALTIDPKDDGAVAVAGGDVFRRWISNPHPEISLRTLFLPVWYEGYAAPRWVWQSTGGSDAFEPKLSLWPLIFGTLKATLYAMLFSVPLALLAAVYVSQLAPTWLQTVVKPTIELMAAVPSVVVGFLAALWLAPRLESALVAVTLAAIGLPLAVVISLAAWRVVPARLRRRLPDGGELLVLLAAGAAVVAAGAALAGPIEARFFSGDFQRYLFTEWGLRYDQRNAVVVGLGLGFAVIPVIFTIAEDACSAVPRALVNASRALGATRWQTAVRLVVPAASPGLFAAVMLGLGRAVGETMIVLMAAGNTPVLDLSLFNGMRTMSAAIAVEIPEAPVGDTLFRVLFLTGILLFAFTMVLTTAADLVGSYLRKRYARF
jgi:phosphate transport system permease protein